MSGAAPLVGFAVARAVGARLGLTVWILRTVSEPSDTHQSAPSGPIWRSTGPFASG